MIGIRTTARVCMMMTLAYGFADPCIPENVVYSLTLKYLSRDPNQGKCIRACIHTYIYIYVYIYIYLYIQINKQTNIYIYIYIHTYIYIYTYERQAFLSEELNCLWGIRNRSLHGKSTFVWAAITCMLRGRDRVYMGRDNAKYQKR